MNLSKHIWYLFKGLFIVCTAIASVAAALSGIYWMGHVINYILDIHPTFIEKIYATGGTFSLFLVLGLFYLIGREHEEVKERRALQNKLFSHHSSLTLGPKE